MYLVYTCNRLYLRFGTIEAETIMRTTDLSSSTFLLSRLAIFFPPSFPPAITVIPYREISSPLLEIKASFFLRTRRRKASCRTTLPV